MTLAWKTDLSSGRKMVLLALCDNANDQGECYPSIKAIAVKCSMGERTVQQHIKDMEEDGIVLRVMRKGRSTVYQIDPRKFRTPAESAPPQNSHHPPADSAPPPPQNSRPGPANSAPITITEPSIESSGNRQEAQAPSKTDPVWQPLKALTAAGVKKQTAKDWLALRKAKSAPVTETVFDLAMVAAKQAGVTLQQALEICCVRGWTGYKAEWIKKHLAEEGGNAGAPAPNKQEALEERNRAVAARLAAGGKK